MARSNTPRSHAESRPATQRTKRRSEGEPHGPPVTTLTRRQREIVGLIAQGYTNQQIAEELVLTVGTVANHVEAILRRLEIDSRGQATAWAIEHGLSTTQDRLLTTLERLLEIQEPTLQAGLSQAATLISQVLGTDKVDAFLREPATATLVAVGASDTPMGHQQRAIGLDRQPVVNGGRAVMIFETGQTHINGHVDQDAEELVGMKKGLRVRSQIGVPLDVAGVRRGVLMAQSGAADFFSERDLRFLQAVARWVGGLIHRTELAEEVTAATVEKLRRAAAEELVTVLAHDLGNHLTPMVIREQLLRRQAREAGQADYLHHAEETLLGLYRLQGLIVELLDIARLKQGLFAIHPEPVDLAALVRETAAHFTTEGARVTVQTPDELRLAADPGRLRQALENLLVNAQKHTPAGTTVVVTVAAEERDGRPWAVLRVTDQGPGIPSELLPCLFARFAAGSGSTGLGLGLYLAQGIARAHGGELTVQSTVGQGARFDLALPADEPARSGRSNGWDGAALAGSGSPVTGPTRSD